MTSNKPEQVLIIEPQYELKFRGEFLDGNSTIMKLTNPTQDKVFFKIKTTAPKKYLVRPNIGLLGPHGKVDVCITPQPVHYHPKEKSRPKFMVQSVIAPPGKTNTEEIWKELTPDQLMDTKLRVSFDVPSPNDTLEPVEQSEENAVRTQSQTLKLGADKAEDASGRIIKLIEVEKKLRIENLELREELINLRERQMTQSRAAVAARVQYRSPQFKHNPIHLMVFSICVALLGIVIGKLLM